MSMIFRFATDLSTWVLSNVSCRFVCINFSNGQPTMPFDSQTQILSVCISARKEVPISIYSFFLDQSPIPVVEETKFLRFIFDRMLSFVPHLKYVKKKGLKALNILNVIGNSEWGADQKIMPHPYRSLVRSKLDYGWFMYGSARKSDPIHNQVLDFCLGTVRTSPVESLYVDAHEPCWCTRHAKLSLQYASKIKSLPKHPIHDAVFDNKYMVGYPNNVFIGKF